jgi:hypothetical protein
MKIIIVSNFFLLILFSSCSTKKGNVSIYNDILLNNKVRIDDKPIVGNTTANERYCKVYLTPGNHFVSINNGERKEFTVGDKGGILNLGNIPFIQYGIKFMPFKMPNYEKPDKRTIPIIIDSIVVFERNDFSSEESIIEVLHWPGAKRYFLNDLIKYPASQLFIDKTWDYGLGEKLPDSIINAIDAGLAKSARHQSRIVDEKTFLKYVKMTPGYCTEVMKKKAAVEEAINNLK